ncbi:MAG: rubrerythrin family protein [Planctomycetia bacterium]|nr:rubrerythrin family protein [Planctomycetia bacterium]
MNIRGSQTEKNLMFSFANESQARNRYNYYASVAKKEGYVQISKIFEETADQEKEHAKRFFKFLEGGTVEVRAEFPAGTISTTIENLRSAASGENEEWTELYPNFAETARAEGYDEIASIFQAVAIAERQHEKRYLGVLSNIENGSVFKVETVIKWRCLNCGYVHEGNEAPDLCPACAHPQMYFERLAENW